MKLFSLVLINIILVSSAFAQQDYPSFGKVSVTPDTVAIVMKQLPPCSLPDGSPSSDFPAYAPAADIAGIRIQNNLDQPVQVQYMTVETDHDVLEVSTDNDMRSMFVTNVVPAHSSISSVCGLHVSNIDVGVAGAVTIPARLDVLVEGKDSHGVVTLFEDKTNLNLQWDGRY